MVRCPESRLAVVEQDRGNACRLEAPDVGDAGDAAQEHAVDPTAGQISEETALGRQGVSRAGDDQRVAALGGRLLDGLGERGEERVGDIGEHDREQPARSAPECAGGDVRLVAEQPDRLTHLRLARGGDVLRPVVDDVADDGGADAGQLGDVLERGARFHATRMTG